MPNRLADALSPYLQQHASNPVAWHEWGEEAFVEARERDVPIFLSVGYSACHWCHVMAHESFEDPDVAEQLNAGFVSIKVDREERPDVDAVYMSATTALTGQGGWPMSVWLDHEGRAFYAGTYYPPAPTGGMPGFPQVLAGISDAWQQRRGEVEQASAQINELLLERESAMVGERRKRLDPLPVMSMAVQRLHRAFDPLEAGFGMAPKFPPSMTLEFLLRFAALAGPDDEQRTEAMEMVTRTCEAMARGGIYDQLAGGFARYAVDREWVVPHFEKMLYDNALLARVYTHLYTATGSPLAERIVEETLDFLIRDLGTDEGAFAAALDADAPPESDPGATPVEGATYAWSPAELEAVLGAEDAAWAAELLGVTDAGTFEHGRSTLRLRADPDDADRWALVRLRLFAARAGRPQPARDDKVVAAWNALAITALAEAGAVFDRNDWTFAAMRAGAVLRDVHVRDGRLLRVSRDGVAGHAAGVLDDYALTIEAFLAIEAVSGDGTWFGGARTLTDVMLDQFGDGPDGGFCDTPSDGDALVRRPRDPADNASPSGASAAVHALVSMAALTGRHDLREGAERTLAGLADLMTQQPRFAGWSLAALAALADGPREVAIVATVAAAETQALLSAAFAGTAPGKVIARVSPNEVNETIPLLEGRIAVDGLPTAYVCRQFVCNLPTTDPDELRAQLTRGTP